MAEQKKSRFHRDVERSYDETTIYAPKGVNRAAMDDWASDVAEDGSVVVPRYAVRVLVDSHGFSETQWAESSPFRRDAPPAKPETAAIDKRK